MRLPGDELVGEPAQSVTRAVSIAAASDRIWPWLAQIGTDRAGWYSYDWLENLFGLEVHSANRIHPEWQELEVGDRVVLARDRDHGFAGLSLPCAIVAVGKALVLREAPPEMAWDAVWSFVILPDGPGHSRLLTRSRSQQRPGPPGWLGRLAVELMDPVTLIMTRRMLLGIKRRAEAPGMTAG